MGEPWRFHTAWLDPVSDSPDEWWIHCPSADLPDWVAGETVVHYGKVHDYEIVENWADDFAFAAWAADESHEVGLEASQHGVRVSLQDRDGYSYMSVSPEQAREMAEYLTRWAKGAVNA